MTRPQLPLTQVDPAAATAMANFHSNIVAEVQKEIAANRIVVVGMAQNPVCTSARKILDKNGLKYKYMEYGSYFSMWKPRLALKLWSGWPTYPQVFIEGRLIGGFTDLRRWIHEGRLKN